MIDRNSSTNESLKIFYIHIILCQHCCPLRDKNNTVTQIVTLHYYYRLFLRVYDLDMTACPTIRAKRWDRQPNYLQNRGKRTARWGRGESFYGVYWENMYIRTSLFRKSQPI